MLIGVPLKMFFFLKYKKKTKKQQRSNQKRKIFIEWFCFLPKQTKETYLLSFCDKINKLTLKDSTISYSFTLFIFGGPYHLSSFTVPRDVILLININIKIISLNFFSKTT